MCVNNAVCKTCSLHKRKFSSSHLFRTPFIMAAKFYTFCSTPHYAKTRGLVPGSQTNVQHFTNLYARIPLLLKVPCDAFFAKIVPCSSTARNLSKSHWRHQCGVLLSKMSWQLGKHKTSQQFLVLYEDDQDNPQNNPWHTQQLTLCALWFCCGALCKVQTQI